jgi:hypothetical protein
VIKTDTGFDFIQPEFLNILFFQQKNLVIFPYVDLKHLHTLELFTAGYNVVDLESTALYNLKEIIEFGADNSYSQSKSLYFIYNLDREKLDEIMKLDGEFRSVLNINENISDLVDESRYIFYNKKNMQFLNYNKNENDLEFENYLISSSSNKAILQDKIQNIKTLATRIFVEINNNTSDELPVILKDYDRKYWSRILDFVRNYFQIDIPDVYYKKCNSEHRFMIQKPFKNTGKLQDFSNEYGLIISSSKHITREFIQLLHEYRSKRVNPGNLELEQLYNPQKLYDYLRNHHWKKGIPEDFIGDWVKMGITNYSLNANDITDFKSIFKNLKIPKEAIIKVLHREEEEFSPHFGEVSINPVQDDYDDIPSIKNYQIFKQWILKKLDNIEEIIRKNSTYL